MPVDLRHPWDLRYIHAILLAYLAAITDPAFLEPLRVAFFNMRAPPQQAPPEVTLYSIPIEMVLQACRRVVLPSNPNSMARDGDETDEEDDPEPQRPRQPEIMQVQQAKAERMQEAALNSSSNGGVSRANARGLVRAEPYGRRPDAGPSNRANGRRVANNDSNGGNPVAGSSNHPNALHAAVGPSNHSNWRNAEAGPNDHSSRESAVAGPSNHPNALRLDTEPSSHSTWQNAEAGPSNPSTSSAAPPRPVLDEPPRDVSDQEKLDPRDKGKQRAGEPSRSGHQLPTSSLEQYFLPSSLDSLFSVLDVNGGQNSSDEDAGVSSASSGFTPAPVPAQEQSAPYQPSSQPPTQSSSQPTSQPLPQPPSQPTSQPSLLSRLSARAEAPVQEEPSPLPEYPAFEAARPQYTFQEQQPSQPPFQQAAAWNPEQSSSSNWVPINNNAQPNTFQPEVSDTFQAERVQTQPSAQQLPASFNDEDTDMDVDMDIDMDTARVQMNQHAQLPHQQSEPQTSFAYTPANTWVPTQQRAQQEEQRQFFNNSNLQNAWASTSNAQQSGGNLADAWAPTQSAQQAPPQANFGGEVDPNWVQMYYHAQQRLQELGCFSPNTIQLTQEALLLLQAQAAPNFQLTYVEPVDRAAEQLKNANIFWEEKIAAVRAQEQLSTSFVPSPTPTFDTAPPPPAQSQTDGPALTPEEAASERRFRDLVRRAEGEAADRRRNPVNYAAASARGPSATGYLNRRVAEVPVHLPRPIRPLPGRTNALRHPQVANGPLGSEANLQYRLEQERRLEEQARPRQSRADRARPSAESASKQQKRRRDDTTPPPPSHVPTADDEPGPSKRARSEPPKVYAEVQVEVEVDTRTRLISGGSNGVVSWNTYSRLATRREEKERKASRVCPSLSSIAGFFSARLAFMKS